MSAKLHGKVHRYLLVQYARAIGVPASDRAIRAAKHLLLVLAEHYNDESGKCNPSMSTLSTLTERSHGATVESMNLLKTMRLVTVLKNAKGGRETPLYALHFPRYDEFSHPVGKSSGAPVQRTEINTVLNPSHTAEVPEPSPQKEASSPPQRTGILIEPLDESLIKSLRNIKDRKEERDETIRLGKKYSIHMTNDMSVWQVQEALLKLLNTT